MLMCTADGDVYSWGWGDKGQLGHGDNANLDRPRIIQDSFNNQKVVNVSCGLAHSAAITSEGELHMWGWDEYGQLGLGSFAFGKTNVLHSFCMLRHRSWCH